MFPTISVIASALVLCASIGAVVSAYLNMREAKRVNKMLKEAIAMHKRERRDR